MFNQDVIHEFDWLWSEFGSTKDYIAYREAVEKVIQQYAASYRIVRTNPKAGTFIEILDAKGLIVIVYYDSPSDIEAKYNIKAVK